MIGTSKPELGNGMRRFPVGNYNIFYFPTETGVENFRVLHSSRDNVLVPEDHPEQPN